MINKKYLSHVVMTVLMALLDCPIMAKDSRDQDIFGGAEPNNTPTPAGVAKASESSKNDSLNDNLQVGGRLEIKASSGVPEGTPAAKANLSQLKRADVYFDSRPRKDLRGFLRTRFTLQTPTNTATSQETLATDIDELWFKAEIKQAAYLTMGKQHLKWGSGRLWNPTDFAASTARNPFEIFDDRLGKNLLKIHWPFEKEGHNAYLVLDVDQAHRNDDVALLMRGEFTLGSSAELAISARKARQGPDQVGVDISSALGVFDVYGEVAASRRLGKTFYRGPYNPDAGVFPSSETDDHKTFLQSVVGIQYGFKYNSEDTLTISLEYFQNGAGYNDRELELYALVKGSESPLSSGRRYIGNALRLPSPGSWNDLSVFVTTLKNLSDGTGLSRLTATYDVKKELTLESFVSRCFGDYGSLCFRVPESVKAFGNSPAVSQAERVTIAGLPTHRTLTNFGFGLSMNF